MPAHRKTGDAARLRMEACGLRWLHEAADDGGAPVVGLLAEGDGWLDLEPLTKARATPAAAEAFGRALARTHAAGAPSLGCAPPGWHGDGVRRSGPMFLVDHDAPPRFGTWGEFYAEFQVRPYVRRAEERGALDADGAAVLNQVADRVAAGHFDAPQPRLVGERVSRLHGDLWGGNVVWAAPDGRGVLIDPTAHGGHAETDLAALALFGVPYLDRILAGYDEVSPIADGWPERVGVHQLVMLLMHAVIYGSGYGQEAVSVARRYVWAESGRRESAYGCEAIGTSERDERHPCKNWRHEP